MSANSAGNGSITETSCTPKNVDVPIVRSSALSDDLIKEWCELLFDPEKSTKEIINDLIYTPKGKWRGEMSAVDVSVCLRALQLIKEGVIRDNPATKSTPAVRDLGAADLQDEVLDDNSD